MPLVPELGRQKLVDLFDFKASLVCVVSSKKARSSYIVISYFEKQSKTKQNKENTYKKNQRSKFKIPVDTMVHLLQLI